MFVIAQGSWVTIERVVLEASARALNLPDETRVTPLRMWVKGTLLAEAAIGEKVSVITVTGRREHGTLLEVNPTYTVDYGSYIPELRQIGEQVKARLWGGAKE
ncbi:MAG: 2-amino-4-oxopentanoate thiolase subunit OrtA [Symbiobacteriaceae bacterium]|nr:2-amino-4-oxopentanoate thiolase subunit OrtA [Symbiobacteriaceae bacterium]